MTVEIREARAEDVQALVELITYLGHSIDEPTIGKNLTALAQLQESPLVAVEGSRIIGMCGIHKAILIHRDAPLGRICAMVIAEDAQGRRIGRKLVEAAESRLRAAGSKLIEVTSNDRRVDAHAFYEHLGYERTSARFAKQL